MMLMHCVALSLRTRWFAIWNSIKGLSLAVGSFIECCFFKASDHYEGDLKIINFAIFMFYSDFYRCKV